MTRPKEPEFLIQWKASMRAGPPKCCHSCDHYDHNGKCLEFDMVPPDEFINTQNSCEMWSEEVPF